jgi:hopene-associated glycosyltransferase HpnB
MIAITAGAAAVAVWLYLLFARGGYWLEFTRPPAAAITAPSPPRTVAVIPARNEAASIAQAIQSLLPQVDHIVLVDDGSHDGTAEAARAAGSEANLTVVAGAPLPPGWTGKLWAVEQGVRRASELAPEYLLLTDADIDHGAGSVKMLAARAASEGYDLTSYMATLHCETFAEKALVPAFVYFFLSLYPPAWIRDGRRSAAGAAGGCLLIRRDALERIGGIAAIRGELIDDCALARAVKRSGGRVWLGLGAATRSLRVYESAADMERMIARTAFTQLRHSVWLLATTLAALAATYWLGPVLVFAGSGAAAILGGAAWLLMSISYFPALRFYRRGMFWIPMLPLVAGFYAWSTVHSAVLYWRGSGGMWKGRAQAGGSISR